MQEKTPEGYCRFCGRPGYKTDSTGWICRNLAERDACNPATKVPRKAEATPGRNELCPCGSGKKYKKCHG